MGCEDCEQRGFTYDFLLYQGDNVELSREARRQFGLGAIVQPPK